jgi:hypothetical protein|tara:strand:+ start:883 stop:1332 length:450 start_codon:yes stop_codon:yes gene_type:complete
MTQLFSIHIFSRKGACLYYKQLSRPLDSGSRSGEKTPNELEQEHKLMFGFLFSLKQFVHKISPDGPGPSGFYACNTSTYKLHYHEVPSGMRLVLCTEKNAPDLREALRHIYANIVVETLVKNPLWQPDTPIDAPAFVEQLDGYLKGLAA